MATQRGRKSALKSTALTAADFAKTVTSKRLAPTGGLSEAEKAVWLEVVNDQPANAFTITHAPMLEMYCRHVVRSRVLAILIDQLGPEALIVDPKGYDLYLKMAERESRAASSFATRLRITRQAVDQQTIARALINGSPATAKKPWEVDDET